MMLIGSRALALVAPNLLDRKPRDFDYIGTEDEWQSWRSKHLGSIGKIEREWDEGNKHIIKAEIPIEWEVVTPGSSAEMLYAIPAIATPLGRIPDLNTLFTIKASHRYKKNSPHVFKTLLDYHRMKAAGAKVERLDILKLREKETYTYKHPSLNQNKQQFFSDVYVYDHDDIHKAVALDGAPAYTKYADPTHDVRSSKHRFFNEVSHEVRIQGGIEEACTLAIERSLVPHPGVWTPKKAWTFAFGKVITSITSGWFREWCYENAIEIMKRYPEDYYDRFTKALTEGKVKPYEG
jgi:hypothetical protein